MQPGTRAPGAQLLVHKSDHDTCPLRGTCKGQPGGRHVAEALLERRQCHIRDRLACRRADGACCNAPCHAPTRAQTHITVLPIPLERRMGPKRSTLTNRKHARAKARPADSSNVQSTLLSPSLALVPPSSEHSSGHLSELQQPPTLSSKRPQNSSDMPKPSAKRGPQRASAERTDSSMESSVPASGEQNLRRLKKKLRQIEQLRQRDAAKLDADAQRKLLQHGQISLEIEMLEALLLPSTADGAGSSSIVDDVVNLRLSSPSLAEEGRRDSHGRAEEARQLARQEATKALAAKLAPFDGRCWWCWEGGCPHDPDTRACCQAKVDALQAMAFRCDEPPVTRLAAKGCTLSLSLKQVALRCAGPWPLVYAYFTLATPRLGSMSVQA